MFGEKHTSRCQGPMHPPAGTIPTSRLRVEPPYFAMKLADSPDLLVGRPPPAVAHNICGFLPLVTCYSFSQQRPFSSHSSPQRAHIPCNLSEGSIYDVMFWHKTFSPGQIRMHRPVGIYKFRRFVKAHYEHMWGLTFRGSCPKNGSCLGRTVGAMVRCSSFPFRQSHSHHLP